MVRSGTPEPAGREQSLGELVSLATKDISQLVRSEIALAKSELRVDIKRIGMAGVFAGIAAFFGCLVLFSLCFAYAYGLRAVGAPGGMWGAFLFVALTLLVLAAIVGLSAWLAVRHLSGMKKTRESVTEGIGMLRRDGKDGNASLSASDFDGKGRTSLRAGTAAPASATASTTASTTSGATASDGGIADGQRPELTSRKPR
jgi:membrane protein implicated in regulation of membrane protease activity